MASTTPRAKKSKEEAVTQESGAVLNVPETPPETLPNATELDIRKDKEFNMYLRWLQLPPSFRRLSEDELDEYGLDEYDKELIQLKTKTAFSEFSGIARTTIASWDEKLREVQYAKSYTAPEWAMKQDGTVLRSLLKNIKKYGKGQDAKAWFEIVHGIGAKNGTTINNNQAVMVPWGSPEYMKNYQHEA